MEHHAGDLEYGHGFSKDQLAQADEMLAGSALEGVGLADPAPVMSTSAIKGEFAQHTPEQYAKAASIVQNLPLRHQFLEGEFKNDYLDALEESMRLKGTLLKLRELLLAPGRNAEERERILARIETLNGELDQLEREMRVFSK